VCGKERKTKVSLGSEKIKSVFYKWGKTEATVCGEQPKKLRILTVCPILAVSSKRAREESALIYLLLV